LLVLFHFASARNTERLYLWGSSHIKGDYLCTIDFDQTSDTYGEVLHNTYLTATSTRLSQGNAAHHLGLSEDHKYLVGGGFISYQQGKDDIFVFEVDLTTLTPTFKYSVNVPGGCTDEILNIGGSIFMIMMMCNDAGDSPGHIVWLDAATGEFRDWAKSPLVDFNPHGCSYKEGMGLLVADYVQPASLYTFPPKIVFRDTVRFFNPDGTINKTIIPINAKNEGLIDVQWIPNDPEARAFTSGTTGNTLYLLKPSDGTSKQVFKFETISRGIPGLSAGFLPLSPDGSQLLTAFAMRYIALFNISEPTKPTPLSVFDFCRPPAIRGIPDFTFECDTANDNVGSHSIVRLGNRVVVVNSFLVLGNFNFGGTRTVHSFLLDSPLNKITYDVDFAPVIEMEAPHGIKIGVYEVADVPPPPPSAGVRGAVQVVLFMFGLMWLCC